MTGFETATFRDENNLIQLNYVLLISYSEIIFLYSFKFYADLIYYHTAFT